MIKMLDYANEGYDSNGKAKIRAVFYADASSDLANYATAERVDSVNQVIVAGSLARLADGTIYQMDSNNDWAVI